jgi:hypothetical protein
MARPRCRRCWILLALRAMQVSYHPSFFRHDKLTTPYSCLTARRRRKAGRQPFYGTGWAARPGNNTAQPYYNNNNNYNQPAPPYSSEPQGANQGYYGGGANHYGQQQNGVELQQPQPAYGGQNTYQPPPGPPPGKGDGIVR